MGLLSVDIAKVKRPSLRGGNPQEAATEKPPREEGLVAKAPQALNSSRLIAIAQRIIKPETSYSKEEVIARIVEDTQVSQERAEAGFNLMLQAEAIELTVAGRYCLTGSTPF